MGLGIFYLVYGPDNGSGTYASARLSVLIWSKKNGYERGYKTTFENINFQNYNH